MIGRRRMLGTGVAAGVLGAFAEEALAAEPVAAMQRGDPDTERVVRALEQVRDAVRAEREFPELAAIRAAQQLFLRSNGKLPEFIEVGMSVWFGVYDWHVRWQQPLQVGRDPSNRYTIRLLETAVVLRPEAQDNFVGIPYDAVR